jgi:DMSO/TMAO reductase YedYZ molybdopterin-dependent catalytic subunit
MSNADHSSLDGSNLHRANMHEPRLEPSNLSRRELLVQGGTLAAGLALMPSELAARFVRLSPQESVVPWMDAQNGAANTFNWETLSSWVTPTDKLFRVGHYNTPEIAESDWSLQITGLVERPRSFTLAEIQARARQSVVFALECAGNRGLPGFMGGVHNAEWSGTPLSAVLQEAGVHEEGIEVVFFGSDEGQEEIRDTPVTHNFARSMSIEDAMDSNVLLCYEVNGEPLPTAHGFPLRLVVPGWYGVASVKWLKRIEIRDTRFMGRFMARDYVTLRQEDRNGEEIWAETSVGRAKINSIPAKVTRDGSRHRIHGTAWGADVVRVEVKIDDGPWQPARLGEGRDDPFTWTFWDIDWDTPPTGEHAITCRAVDADGVVQPHADDDSIVQKITYWESNQQAVRRILIE